MNMTRIFPAVFVFASVVALAGCQSGANPPGHGEVLLAGAPDSATAVTVANSAQWDMRAHGSERTYRVFVSVPEAPAPAAGYPVLYVLDANSMFLTAMETVRRYEGRPDTSDAPPTVVVGIGYPPETDISPARVWALTPSADVAEPLIDIPTGGADQFLKFIQTQVKPAVAAFVDIDSKRQTLFGHSLGGLFTLHVLASKPQTFQTYVAASPSLWYGKNTVLKELDAMADSFTLAAGEAPLRVQLTVGEFEQTLAPWVGPRGPDSAKMLTAMAQVPHAIHAMQVLDASKDISARYQLIIGEDHGSVIPAAIMHAVRFMERGYLLPQAKAPPVPGPQEYLDMSADQRYRLRMQVRALPDALRIPWVEGLKKSVSQLPDEPHHALHRERNRMDKLHGTLPRAVNAE